jgi:hypothetical protein
MLGAMGKNRKKPRRRVRVNGVFCIEGDWWNQPIESSVRPVMEMLRQWDPYFVHFMRRDVATRAEFEHYLRQWSSKKYSRYPVLYIALHGDEGVVSFGDLRKPENCVTLREIAEILEGRCSGRVIHFGACDTVHVHGNHLRSVLKKTGALAVSGYGGRMNWLEASALDALWFAALQGRSMTVRGVRAAVKELNQSSRSLVSFGGMQVSCRA